MYGYKVNGGHIIDDALDVLVPFTDDRVLDAGEFIHYCDHYGDCMPDNVVIGTIILEGVDVVEVQPLDVSSVDLAETDAVFDAVIKSGMEHECQVPSLYMMTVVG